MNAYLLAAWQTYGPYLLAVPAALTILVLFLIQEGIQVAVQGRRYGVAMFLIVGMFAVDFVIGIPLALVGVTARWAVWTPLVANLGMFLVAHFAEVRVIRRWLQPKQYPKFRVTDKDVRLWSTSDRTTRKSEHTFEADDVIEIIGMGERNGDYQFVNVRGLGKGWINITYLEEVA